MVPDSPVTVHIRCGSDIHDALRVLQEEREPLPFLGDMMFWHSLEDLKNASAYPFETLSIGNAVSWAERTLKITDIGKNLLRGNDNFLDLYRGVQIAGRFDGSERRFRSRLPTRHRTEGVWFVFRSSGTGLSSVDRRSQSLKVTFGYSEWSRFSTVPSAQLGGAPARPRLVSKHFSAFLWYCDA